MTKIYLRIAILALFALPAYGQQQATAFTNARIIPIVGQPIDRGTIVFQNGKIVSVGCSIRIPSGAATHVMSGYTNMTGHVAPHSPNSRTSGAVGTLTHL